MSERKLRVIAASYMLGGVDFMTPFLNQAFDELDSLQERLAIMNLDIVTEPLSQIIDQETNLVIESHSLTHKVGKWHVGTLDLVVADDVNYDQLLRSMAQVAAANNFPTLEI